MSADVRAEKAAAALYDARQSKQAIAPVSETQGIVDPALAYAVQEMNTARWLENGRRVVGRKIGLTSLAVQKQLGVGEPDYGMLWADMAYENGAVVPIERFIQPRVEAEVAFIIRRRLDSATSTLDEVAAAVGCALAAVEIVDSAIADWKITLADTIADNASGGGFVLGDVRRSLDEVDLRLCGMILSRNGTPASLGVGAACLGHPLNATLWLARKMAAVGRPLDEGDIVLSGALGPMADVAAGDRIEVEIQGFAPIQFRFATEVGS
jgi:2-keto-4-pentenoate hydratase